jgi:hypothetical protein
VLLVPDFCLQLPLACLHRPEFTFLREQLPPQLLVLRLSSATRRPFSTQGQLERVALTL